MDNRLTRCLLISVCFLLILNGYAAPHCQVVKSTCVVPGGTRIIDGFKVYQACWAYQQKKRCFYPAKNNCGLLAQQGCEQIDSACQQWIGSICVVRHQTYRCPIKSCHVSDNLICGKHVFCMDDHCAPKKNEKSSQQDFNQAIGDMGAINGVGESIQKSNPQRPVAFAGVALHCKKTTIVTKFDDCCQKGGWGSDLGLTHCTATEKKLGKAREKGLAVYVGRYKNGLFSAVEHKVYCVFPSKIAQIIQAQGRYQQLHISFGDAKHPNCRGLTPKELQRMNFHAMDFSAITDQLKHQMQLPDVNKLSHRVRTRVHDHIEQTIGGAS